jgi:hypothetical protein
MKRHLLRSLSFGCVTLAFASAGFARQIQTPAQGMSSNPSETSPTVQVPSPMNQAAPSGPCIPRSGTLPGTDVTTTTGFTPSLTPPSPSPSPPLTGFSAASFGPPVPSTTRAFSSSPFSGAFGSFAPFATGPTGFGTTSIGLAPRQTPTGFTSSNGFTASTGVATSTGFTSSITGFTATSSRPRSVGFASSLMATSPSTAGAIGVSPCPAQ